MSAAIKPKPLKLTRPEPSEAAILDAVKRALALHPAVAWFERMNSGAGFLWRPGSAKSQFMRFGFPGCPDILGQLVDGRLLAIEVKKPSGTVSKEQAAFLQQATKHGALALVARSVDEVLAALNGVVRDRNSAQENGQVVGR